MTISDVEHEIANFGAPPGAPKFQTTATGEVERVGYTAWLLSLKAVDEPTMRRYAVRAGRLLESAKRLRNGTPCNYSEAAAWHDRAEAGERALRQVGTTQSPYDLIKLARVIVVGADAHAVLVRWGH